MTGTNDLPESLAVLNGQLFVSDGSGGVNLINLSSGVVASRSTTPGVGLTGLGILSQFAPGLSLNGGIVFVPVSIPEPASVITSALAIVFLNIFVKIRKAQPRH